MKFRLLFFIITSLYIFYTFSQELALVRENSTFGYLNKVGNYAIKSQFKIVKSFSNGMTNVLKEGKWSSINSDSKRVLLPAKKHIKQFNSGFILAYKNKKWGYLTTEGKPLENKWYKMLNYVYINNRIV